MGVAASEKLWQTETFKRLSFHINFKFSKAAAILRTIANRVQSLFIPPGGSIYQLSSDSC